MIESNMSLHLGHYWEGQSFDRETNPNADNEFSRQVIGMLRKKFTTVTGAGMSLTTSTYPLGL